MATTNHVIIANSDPVDASNPFPHIWRLSRAMMKAGWKYLAAGNGDTTVKDTSADPESDPWISWSAGTISNAGALASADIEAPTRGRAKVTGLSGIVAADKGRFLHIAGSGPTNNHYHQIEEVIDATTVKIDARTFAVVADTTVDWEIRDPTLALAAPGALNTNLGWWLARGPSILKIPIDAAPVAGANGLNFIRGENVKQATTGAEGELLGYVYWGGYGYLVISPRVRGTGIGVYGWDIGNVVMGDVSNATVTQVGTTLEYRHECVLVKLANASAGSIFHGCFEPVVEEVDMFSFAIRLSGATHSRPPGQNSDFPTNAYVSLGSTTYTTGTRWDCHTSARTIGHGQIMCADAIEETLYSADGSWTLAMAENTASTGTHIGHAFLRLINTDNGDVDPFVAFNSNANGNLYTNTRITASGHASGLLDCFTTAAWSGTVTARRFFGWLGKGLFHQQHQEYELAFLMPNQTATTPIAGTNTTNYSRPECELANKRSGEAIWVVSCGASDGKSTAGAKTYKGIIRWWSVIMGGYGLELYDSSTLVQLSPTSGAFLVGPWDGISIPTRT